MKLNEKFGGKNKQFRFDKISCGCGVSLLNSREPLTKMKDLLYLFVLGADVQPLHGSIHQT